MQKLSHALRWTVATVTTLFGAVCLFLAFPSWEADQRLGLTVYMVTQGVMYLVAGVSLAQQAWRTLGMVLAPLALVQLVYAAEVTPAGPLGGTLFGIVVGGMGPTLLLAAAALVFWATTTSGWRAPRPKTPGSPLSRG